MNPTESELRLDRRNFMGVGLGLLAAPALRARGADLVLLGGRITTHDQSQPEVSALAIQGGRIIARGQIEDVRPLIGLATRRIELDGRRVIPGLCDSHTHIVRGGRTWTQELRFEGLTSLAEGLRRIRAAAARTPPGQWVRVVGGWSPHQFRERRLPELAEIAAAAGEVPCFVMYLYSRGWLNAAGVQALGLSPDRPTPPGSRIEFHREGAILYADPHPGLLYQTVAALPGADLEEEIIGTRRVFRELNRLGVTSLIDAGGGGHRWPTGYLAAQTLNASGRSPMRVATYLFAQDRGREEAEIADWSRRQRIGQQLSMRLDGLVLSGAGENLVASASDFENFLSPRPELSAEMEGELHRVLRHLVRIRWPIRIHATYEESIQRILDVFERVDAEVGLRGLRFAVDHGETIGSNSLARLKALGGGLAVQHRMAFAGEEFLLRYGKDAAAKAPPMKSILAAGVPLGLGTDATRVASYDPWEALHWAISGCTIGDTPLLQDSECLSREEALSAMSSGSAWFSSAEGRRGTLAVGMEADLAVLDRDVLTIPEAELRGTRSLLTIVDGEPVFAEGPFAEHDPGPPPASSIPWSVDHQQGWIRERGSA